MAPGRKRGAKGAKAKSELSLGDLVLAKVKGFPAWPAKISRPEDWERAPDPKKYFVQFFGTEEIAFVAPVDIQAFTSEAKNKLSTRCQGKTVKYFAQAVKEICEAFEELEHKNSSGLRDDIDKSALRCEVPPVDGVEDDTAEADLKDEIKRDVTNGEIEVGGLGDHHGPSLERCSQKQGKMDCQDIKPIISRKANVSPVVSSKKKNKLLNDGAHLSKEVVSASSPHSFSCIKEEDSCEDNQEDNGIRAKNSKAVTPAEGLNGGQSDLILDTDGDGQKDISSPLLVSVRVKHSSGGKNDLINGHKSEKMSSGSNRKPQCAEVRKNSSSAALTRLKYDASSCHADSLESAEHTKDGIHRKNVLGRRVKESSSDIKSDLDDVSGKKAKHPEKDRKQFGVVDDGQFGSSKKGYTIQKDTEEVTNDITHPVKKSKCATLVDDAPKGSLQTNRKNDSRSSHALDKKTDNSEHKRSTSHFKTENSLVSRVQAGSGFCNIPSDEDALPPSKRPRRAFGAKSDCATTMDTKLEKVSVALKSEMLCSENVKSPVAHSHTKRRAVRLFDEDDQEEPKTPIHAGSFGKIHAPSQASDCIKDFTVQNEASVLDKPSIGNSGGVVVGPSKECLPSVKLEQPIEKRPKKAIASHASHSPEKLASERISSKEAKQILISPKMSPWSGATDKTMSETPKAHRLSIKVSGAAIQKKTQAGTGKALDMVCDGFNYSQSQAITRRSKPISSGGSMMENISFTGDRLEAGSDDKMSSLIDSKISDSAFSMKHLIAAAQAKRRQPHSQNISHGNASSFLAPSTDVAGRSPSPASADQPFPSGSSNALQPDVHGYYPHSSVASPSHGLRFSSNDQPDAEEFEERRVSSGHRPAGGSLSGGTEAAVARDAFEGMIETLSRTKDSIGRATRLAIVCAKYGIANEVVELLIRKLESEPSLHRKVDLFFLVDSITQGSHSQKGIAGASYIPAVQAALPRLLGAAAPPGAAARENRRQCLKVLRLWLERKILPESLLRRYMDDIGVSNDDVSAGSLLRRPSRAERAVDDPIREMEGMLVDEYGSNATFQLPGFLSAHVFDEDEEEDLPSSSYFEAVGRSPVEPVPATGDPETHMATPNDRRHCILEDVDGELEMEDVSGHPKYERPLFTNGSTEFASQQQGSDEMLEAALNNSNESPLLPEGSPPLPYDSPPPTPPLPSTPPPSLSPPPPPPSPSPPPPPPPPPPLPSMVHSLPPTPSGPQPSLLPHPSLPPQPKTSQQFHTPQSIPSSSPKLTYQASVPHEYCSTSSGSQLVQMTAITPQGGNVDTAVISEMFPQQSPMFVPAGVCDPREPSGFNSSRPLDYGHQDLYVNSQASQSSQQFQPGNAPYTHRSFHPPPPSQTPSSHYSYSHPTVQQHPQHPYPRPYSLTKLPDGPRRYIADEQWRTPTGYFRPPLERPPANNVGFQPSTTNTLPSGASVTGYSVSQMMPGRPDISAHNSWRP